MSVTLTVATINLFGWHGRAPERFPLLEAGLAGALPDLVALQEVAVSQQVGTRLVETLNGAVAAHGVGQPYAYVEQRHLHDPDLSVGVLVRGPILDWQWLDLGGQGRVALAVSTELAGRRLGFVCTHLFWDIGPAGDAARVYQARRLRTWVAELFGDTIAVVGGDFNATPQSPAYNLLRERWLSLYAAWHGTEPTWTTATPLAPAPHGWRGTVDYLFLAPATAPVQVLDARLFLDTPASHDPALYPSDHLGVLARIGLPPVERSTSG